MFLLSLSTLEIKRFSVRRVVWEDNLEWIKVTSVVPFCRVASSVLFNVSASG